MDNIAKKLYPRALENRVPFHDPAAKAVRHKFLRATGINFVALQVLFLCLFSYLFGALFQQTPRTHAMQVLWVDYDGGVIGEAVRDAYKSLQSDSFPTLVERTPTEYASPTDLRDAVCHADYWAAVFVSKGASEAIGHAIAGESTYDPTKIIAYIWNEVRYPTVVDAAIASNMNALSQAARVAYIARYGTDALQSIPRGNKAALAALTNPWTLSSINIQPTTQGTRAVYNTIVMVLILIQDFFFLATINGLYASFQIYTRAKPAIVILIRNIISGAFSMVGALLLTAAIWAFKANWDVSGSQYALTWLLLWLFAHVNFLTLDIFTIWIPPQFVSMALISWVILNVTSIIVPFALSAPFYRWAYALPAHAAYEVLNHIWSNGCNPHLHFALPILFVYELSGLVWTSLGVYKRCHLAMVAKEAAERATEKRVEAAVKLEREHDARRLARQHTAAQSDVAQAGQNAVTETIMQEQEADAQDMREARREIEELQRTETGASRMARFGPSFHIIGSDSD